MPSPRILFWTTVLSLILLLSYFSHASTFSNFTSSSFFTSFRSKPPVKLLDHIPRHLVPTPKNGRRLIVVGDIHGMLEPLDELLERVGFDGERDHLVATGDMISKGPDSSGVVDRLIELGASAVRGNHEDHILKARWKMDRKKRRKERKKKNKQQQKIEEVEEEEDVEDEEGEEMSAQEKMRTASHKRRDRKVAKSLSKKHVAWLSNLPVILSAKPLPIYIVHAGLVPGVQVDKQDPWAVMNMRTIVFPKNLAVTSPNLTPHDADTQQVLSKPPQHPLDSDEEESLDEEEHKALMMMRGKHLIPVDTREGKRWADVWNKYQRHKPGKKRKTVVYGHDAKRGHRVGDYTFGLDSGCATGGALTAVVITGRKGGWDHETVQVDCEAAF